MNMLNGCLAGAILMIRREMFSALKREYGFLLVVGENN
jgi:hypothetical protein